MTMFSGRILLVLGNYGTGAESESEKVTPATSALVGFAPPKQSSKPHQ